MARLRRVPAEDRARHPGRRARALLALLAAAALGACGSSGGGSTTPAAKPVITLGTKNFSEQFILGELYAQALRAKGFRVRLKQNIGSSEIVDRTLLARRIDMYPEYIGVIDGVLARRTDLPHSARETYERARRFEARRGFALMNMTPFFDSLALAVTPAFARRHGLETVGDLRKLPRFTFGGAPENLTRYQGLVGMRRAYGLTNAHFRLTALGKQFAALDSGKADVVNVLTTDPQLRSGRYKVLDDTKGIFGYQNVAPVVSRGVLARQGPGLERTLDAVSARLTNRAMTAMNAQVAIDRRSPRDVARAFLKAQGLL